MTGRILFASAAVLLVSGCRSQPPPQPRGVVVWKAIGSWSGRGNAQTGTFTSDTGGFRVHWETRNTKDTKETKDTKKGMGPDEGRLRVVFHSGDSGREIIEAIDARGTGRGTEEVAAERPRWYYLTIESADVDWTVAVDERIDAQAIKN
jgi:hypothetical protein